jgi:hypothetical protein
MLRFPLGSLFLFAAFSFAQDKGTSVEFDGFKSTTPSTWVAEKPANFLRLIQFKLPKQGADKEDAEVIVFHNITGSAKANIDRWKAQFKAPEGKKIDEVSKVTMFKVADNDVHRLEAEGIYTATPTRDNPKPAAKPGFKGVFYQFETADKVFQIRLVGPTKTVEHYQKGYDEWIKNFKK